MLYKLLNFELHRLGITYQEAATAIDNTESDFILKLYDDKHFSIPEYLVILQLINQHGGTCNPDHFNPFKHYH